MGENLLMCSQAVMFLGLHFSNSQMKYSPLCSAGTREGERLAQGHTASRCQFCSLCHQGLLDFFLTITFCRKVKVLVTQSCLTLCDLMDCSPPGSSLHGILQARILEWVAIPLSRGSSPPRDQTQVSCTAGRFLTV